MKTLHAACADVCVRFGFGQFIYILKKAEEPIPTLFIIHGTVKSKAVEECLSGYLRTGTTPLSKSHQLGKLLNSLSIDLSEELMRVLSDAPLELPLRSSVSFPVNDESGTAVLILASSVAIEEPLLSRAELSHAQNFAQKIHHTANNIISSGELPPSEKLTPREVECLHWASEGKTNWEISQILSVSKRTVIFHLQNAATKLGASNRYQAVAQAAAKGLIKLRKLN